MAYIDREKLLNNLNQIAPEHFNSLINDLIMKQPAEDVEPVIHARWIKSCPNIIFDGCYHCSNCKENIDIATGEETPLDRGLNYCPNCGAKMDWRLNNEHTENT